MAAITHACRKAPQRAIRTFTTISASRASHLPQDPEILPPLDLSTLPSQAHADLQAHREIRSLARKAAWEMPLLASLSKPFTPPTSATPLRWRYTTYMGEQHPASRKVVVEFSPKDIPALDEKAQLKLAKLAGSRWNPVTSSVKISWEGFETQAQNKRYLGELVNNMIKEAKEGKDDFADVPLDLRHVTNKSSRLKGTRLRRARLGRPTTGFPISWRMTSERRAELEAKREEKAQMLSAPVNETARVAVPSGGGAQDAPVELPQEYGATTSNVVSGLDAIETARQIELQRAEEPVMAEARMPLPKGKQGRKEMGQRPSGRR